jgi:hypothetical protein
MSTAASITELSMCSAVFDLSIYFPSLSHLASLGIFEKLCSGARKPFAAVPVSWHSGHLGRFGSLGSGWASGRGGSDG